MKNLLTSFAVLVALGLLTVSALVAQDGVICNEFSLDSSVVGNVLKLKINSDLPDDAIISVTVSRSYWEKGNSEEYASEYFSEESTVGDWRDAREIDISSSIWKARSSEHRAEMAKYGLGYQVGRVSDDIKVRAVLPINGQTNPNFGLRNSNLSGNAVTKESYGNLVEVEMALKKNL